MAIVETPKKNSVNILLNNGSVSGVVKTVSVGLGTLKSAASAWDAQKVMNIVGGLENLFSKELYEVDRVLVSVVEESA